MKSLNPLRYSSHSEVSAVCSAPRSPCITARGSNGFQKSIKNSWKRQVVAFDEQSNLAAEKTVIRSDLWVSTVHVN